MDYESNDYSNIRYDITINGQNQHSTFLYPQDNGNITASLSIVDSLIINKVIYRSVMMLTDENYEFNKIGVAQDVGVVLFSTKNTGEEWTLNKW